MQNHKILIIDDEEINRVLLEEIIHSYDENIAITTTDNASEGLFHYFTRPFTLVLLDIMMPVINGHDFLAIVEKNRQAGHLQYSPNIIVQTAIQSISQLTELTKWECVLEVMRKPIVATRLKEHLNKYCH